MKSAKGKTIARTNLPDKLCRACGRPFSWRRKWARDWDRVVFCSDRCRNDKRQALPGAASTK